jgi:hypothetical protein
MTGLLQDGPPSEHFMTARDYNPESVDAVLMRIETKLDTALARVSQLEATVVALDRFKWLLVGASALGGGVAAKFVTMMKENLKP